jgi:hypothetical protein
MTIPSARFDLGKIENSRCPNHERGRLFRFEHLLFSPQGGEPLPALGGIEIVLENYRYILAVLLHRQINACKGAGRQEAY